MTLFLRRIHHKYVKLGRNRRKKGVWRKPKGRDNKMREKRKGYGAVVSVGYKRKVSERKNPFVVNTLNDFMNLGGEKEVVIGKVGTKKKLELVKKAEEMKIKILNVNPKRFFKKAGGNKK